MSRKSAKTSNLPTPGPNPSGKRAHNNHGRRRRRRPRPKSKQAENKTSQQDESTTDTPIQLQVHNDPKDIDNGEAQDSDDEESDEEYSYQGTESDDDDSLEDVVDADELAYLLHDQHLDFDTDHIPALYYPSLKNRLYTIMRSLKIEHIYTAIKWIIVSTLLLFILGQIGRMQSTVRRNGYCDSYHKVRGGTTGLTTQLRSARQSCIPCPSHGECINGELFCKPLYRTYRSRLNKVVNLVWPMGQQCTRDPVMTSYATKMERAMRSYLSRRQGDRQCHDCHFTTSGIFDASEHPTTFPLVKTEAAHMMETLKHTFGLPLAYNQNHQVELDHLADLALDMVKKNRHVMAWEIDGILYLGTDIAKYSFLCWCWVTLCNSPLLIKVSIPVLALSYALLMLLYSSYQTWATKKHQVKVITEKALDLLKAQRQKYLIDSTLYTPGCSSQYLRQHAMESSDEKSILIWKAVVDRLQEHPCLRHGYTDEGGDLLQYFEWL